MEGSHYINQRWWQQFNHTTKKSYFRITAPGPFFNRKAECRPFDVIVMYHINLVVINPNFACCLVHLFTENVRYRVSQQC